ncbi:hypothetical protein SSX86_016653 [Deinandra increscens subsp. villosa]|uniref:RRM domain-containing protein n=1 Tax=Deinandra increscens subsp. villosa TaxID=3103831 RepID=A0AAP0D353_9ASTR
MAGREKFKVDTWYDAPIRMGSQSVHGDSLKQKDQEVTKYFVSNLPGGCASSDLVKVMKDFVSIKGTYIARKYDKLGKHFGFVSFVNVRDPVALEGDMKDVWIGSYKLFIALARFVDEEKKDWKGGKKWVPVNEGNNMANQQVEELVMDRLDVEIKGGNQCGGGRTFREALLNLDPVKKPNALEVMIDSSVKGSLLWEGSGAVGRVTDFKNLTNLRVWLDLIGHPKVGIREVINYIGANFGLVVQKDVINESVVDLSFALIGVLTDSVQRINQVVNLKWKDNEFAVLVEEECGEWVPECLEDAYACLEDDSLNIEDGGVTRHDDEVKLRRNIDTVEAHEAIGVEEVMINHDRISEELNSQETVNVPSGKERPKKRAREGDDPFDIDKFIFASNGDGLGPREHVEVDRDLDRFVTPDLNGVLADSNTVQEENLTKEVAVEADETMNLGKVLSVEDIDKFGDSVVNVIQREGFQVGI